MLRCSERRDSHDDNRGRSHKNMSDGVNARKYWVNWVWRLGFRVPDRNQNISNINGQPIYPHENRFHCFSEHVNRSCYSDNASTVSKISIKHTKVCQKSNTILETSRSRPLFLTPDMHQLPRRPCIKNTQKIRFDKAFVAVCLKSTERIVKKLVAASSFP